MHERLFFREKSKTFKNLGRTFRWVWRFVFNTWKATGEITKGKSMQIYASPSVVIGLPRWLMGKESTCHAEGTGDMGLITGWGRSPGGMAPTPVFLPGESQGQSSLVGYTLWGRRELDTTERLSTHTCNVVMNRIKNQRIIWGCIGHKYYN